MEETSAIQAIIGCPLFVPPKISFSPPSSPNLDIMTGFLSIAHAEKKSVNHIYPAAFDFAHRGGCLGI